MVGFSVTNIKAFVIGAGDAAQDGLVIARRLVDLNAVPVVSLKAFSLIP